MIQNQYRHNKLSFSWHLGCSNSSSDFGSVWASSSRTNRQEKKRITKSNQCPPQWNQSALICVSWRKKINTRGGSQVGEPTWVMAVIIFISREKKKKTQGFGVLLSSCCCYFLSFRNFFCFVPSVGIFLLTGKLEGRCLNCHALIDSFLIIFLRRLNILVALHFFTLFTGPFSSTIFGFPDFLAFFFDFLERFLLTSYKPKVTVNLVDISRVGREPDCRLFHNDKMSRC